MIVCSPAPDTRPGPGLRWTLPPRLCALIAIPLALTVGACGKPEPGSAPPPAGAGTDTSPGPRTPLAGKLRVKDAWVPVEPLILHDGKMDLFTRCRVLQEDARKVGREVPPLCYDPKARDMASVTRIRVERWLNLPVAMRYLQSRAEGMHFLVERSGSTYQMLDLVYAARRDEAVQRDEIRVVATDENKGRAVVDALRAIYPNATVDEVDKTDVRPMQGPPGGPGGPGGPGRRPGGPPLMPRPPPHTHAHGHDHHDHTGHEHHDH